MARPRLLAAIALTVALGAAGCANIPTEGRPTEVTGDSQQGQFNVQPVPPVPHPGMSEKDIVQGFIAASASFVSDHAAARAFLDDHLQQTWRPGWAAALVVGLATHSIQSGPVTMNGQPTLLGTVTVTAHQVATISDVGRYVTSSASTVYKFHLARVGGLWRITALPSPSSLLLLTQQDFQEVYQPRNLYVWTPDMRALVPEPVFAPEEAGGVAQTLVKALVGNQAQSTWLGSATESRLRGTKLLGGVDIDGQTATVNLGGAAARASPAQFAQLAAQIVVTLTSTAYSQAAVAGMVTLEVNGRVPTIRGGSASGRSRYRNIGRSRYQNLVPNPPTGLPLYFIARSGQVSELRTNTPPQPIQKALASGQRPYSLIAVSAGSKPEFAGALATARGCDIYYGSVSKLGSLSHQAIPIPHSGPCTSLGFDSHGNIWAVTSQDAAWVLPPGSRQPIEVSLPSTSGKVPHYKVLALSVAPDGVRVAMLVQNSHGTRVVLTAIGGSGTSTTFSSMVTIGTGLVDPVSLSWYDAYHVMVLAQDELYDVPVNGGAPIPVSPAPNTTMLTASGPRQIATAGNGQILTSSGPNESLQPAVKGTDPAYPG